MNIYVDERDFPHYTSIDVRTSQEKERDRIRKESEFYYKSILHVLTDMSIPFQVKETETDTIIFWDNYTKVLPFYHDPFHKWKNWEPYRQY